MRSELVSIVLPTYNGAKYLRQSIDSCLAQTYQNIELIVVDDCSTDDTPDIIKSYADSRIRYIRHAQNKKLPLSLNTGFSYATGKYLTWTSDDNYYIPKAIETLVAAFSTNVAVDFVYSDYFNINELDEITPVTVGAPEKLIFYNSIGASFLYKRTIYESLGGFDKEYFLCEDYEYWVRIYLSHFRFHRVSARLYYYRRHSNSLTGLTGAKTMQATELKIINKIFSHSDYKYKLLLKCRALSRWYFRAAVLHRESNNAQLTRECARSAFLAFPPIVLDGVAFRFFISVLLNIVFSKKHKN